MEIQKSKQKLLLVDDNELTRIYFREVFWLHGLEFRYELIMTENVEQASKLLDNETTRPDIIFLGLVMPMKVNGSTITSPEAGFNILRKIKSNPVLRHIKVIIFSAFDKKEYQDQAKALGADAYLVKGQNLPQDILNFVSNVLENHGQ